ncbi:MAG: AbrB/MazE/SpoVT family DNA-binding domain-containing protein [Candidatus Altiarchaeota archaeon]
MEIEFTRPSASGQVVIPKALRREMNITTDDRFLVFGEKDTLVFKRIEKPAVKQSFDELAADLRKGAKEAGLTRKDVADAIKWARARK